MSAPTVDTLSTLGYVGFDNKTVTCAHSQIQMRNMKVKLIIFRDHVNNYEFMGKS